MGTEQNPPPKKRKIEDNFWEKCKKMQPWDRDIAVSNKKKLVSWKWSGKNASKVYKFKQIQKHGKKVFFICLWLILTNYIGEANKNYQKKKGGKGLYILHKLQINTYPYHKWIPSESLNGGYKYILCICHILHMKKGMQNEDSKRVQKQQYILWRSIITSKNTLWVLIRPLWFWNPKII